MTAYVPEGLRSYLPAEDLTGKVGYAAMLTTGGAPKRVSVCTDDERFIGVILYGGTTHNAVAAPALTTAGRAANVQTAGTARAIAQAEIAVGAAVSVHSDGRFRTAAMGEYIVGYAEEGATTAGDSFALRLNGPGGTKS